MGGTQFAEGLVSYWNATNSSNESSALSYIPEAVWNDWTSGYTTNYGGGGGGISAYFPKPTWQTETGATGMTTTVTSDLMTTRGVPDISLTASGEHDPFFFYVDNQIYTGGGTSFDSQIFGGMLALIEQKTGTRLGNINTALYTLGNNVNYYCNTGCNSVFHDVTSGNNGIGGLSGYSAGTGYDLATGWGSVDLNNLANATSVFAPTVSGFKLTSSAALVSGVPTVTVASGNTASTTITVTPVDGFTGTVTFTYQVYGSGSPTVTFSTNPVTISSTTVFSNTMLTLSGATAAASLRRPNTPGKLDHAPTLAEGRFAAGSGIAIASLLLLVLPRKRRLGGLLLVALSITLALGATGCGGSSQATASTSSSSTGTYLVTVTGTSSSGSILQSTTVTFQFN